MTSLSLDPDLTIRRRHDGTIDCEFYRRQRAARERDPDIGPSSPDPPSGSVARPASRALRLFAGALALATAAFWAVMLVSPPVTEAGPAVSMPVHDFMRDALRDLPILEAPRF